MQHFHAARGSTGDEARTIADQTADADGAETVDVFGRIDGFEDLLGIDLRGKGKLDEDAVDRIVVVEILDQFQKSFGGDGGRRRVQPVGHAEMFAGGDFTFDVNLGSGIFADEDRGKAGANALGGEASHFGFQFGEDFVANFQAIENLCWHTERIS